MLSLLTALALANPDVDTEEVSLETAHTGGKARVALGIGSGLAAVGGTLWFLRYGDQLGSGDHAALMMGGGFVGLAGAALGAAGSSWDTPDDAVRSAWVEVDLAKPPAAWAGEARPLGAGLTLAPSARWDGGSAKLPLSVYHSLGSTLDIDPNSQDHTVLEEFGGGMDLSPEVRVRLGRSPVQVGLRSVYLERREHIRYDGRRQPTDLARTLVAPGVPGAVVQVAPGQSIDGWLGPRWDGLRIDGDNAPLYPSALYGEAGWQLQVTGRGPVEAGRLRLSYLHSNFDGSGFNVGPVVGFAGPFRGSVDARLAGRGDWAVQLGADATVGSGGSMSLSIGLVPRGAK